MFFRGGRLPSKVSALVGQDRQGGPLWLCTAVLVLAAQVNARFEMFYKPERNFLTVEVRIHSMKCTVLELLL